MKRTVGAGLVVSMVFALLAARFAAAEKRPVHPAEVQEPAYTGSIRVPSDDGSQSEAAEAQQ